MRGHKAKLICVNPTRVYEAKKLLGRGNSPSQIQPPVNQKLTIQKRAFRDEVKKPKYFIFNFNFRFGMSSFART